MTRTVGVPRYARAYLAGLLLGLPRPAFGQLPSLDPSEVKRCDASHERTRRLEFAKRWFEARTAGRECAVATCPAVVRADCSAWLQEIARALPTIVVVVQADPRASGAVRVAIDGKVVCERLGTQPIELSPGIHHAEFTAQGYPPVRQRIALEEGEKNRLVYVRFEQRSDGSEPVEPASPNWVLAGASLAALLGAGYFYMTGWQDWSNATRTCKPICGLGRTDRVSQELAAGHVLAGAAVVLSGLTLYFYTRAPQSAERPASRSGRSDQPTFGVGVEGTW